MTDWYPWIVLAHVLGAFGFILGHGVSAFAAFRIRAERDPARIGALLDLSGASLTFVYVSLLVLLVAGVTAGFVGDWWGKLWIWLAIGVLVAIIGGMYGLATPYYKSVRRAVGQRTYGDKPDDPLPDPLPAAELAALLEKPRAYQLAALGGIGLAVLVWLMIVKPF